MRLSRTQLGTDPMRALNGWILDARESGLGDEPVFTLATVDAAGAPDARLVVVRTSDVHGLTFYTDTRSPKGRHLSTEPRAALVAYWSTFARQVRLRGKASIAPESESGGAFSTRGRRSQIGYWSNEQSAIVADRASLERQLDETIERFEGEEVPRPAHWVVYRLRPEYIEFWQSGDRRLHDRIAYTLVDGTWHAERLQP